MLKQARKRFFFEKKNQKTFDKLDRTCGKAWGPICKSFLLLFFKKEALSFFHLGATDV
jgi:hypothetical protein